MTLRIRRLAEAFGKPRELEMRATAFLERDARLEEAPRLAPQLGLRAEPAERGEQLRIAVALGEPALGTLDAHARFLGALDRARLRRQFAVERDQLGMPLRGERMLEDLARERALAQGRGMACRRGGDARMQLGAP